MIRTLRPSFRGPRVSCLEITSKRKTSVCRKYGIYKSARQFHRSEVDFHFFLFPSQFDLLEPVDVMYDPHLLAPPQERPRRTRSHSLKSMSQPNLLTPRTKRINSLPSKPVIPPYITIQGCHDIQYSHSDEEELSCDSNDSMGKRKEKGFLKSFPLGLLPFT